MSRRLKLKKTHKNFNEMLETSILINAIEEHSTISQGLNELEIFKKRFIFFC